VDQNTSHAGWDVYLFGIPLIALLVFGFFRLDQVFTSGKARQREPRRPPSLKDKREESMLSDPDGRSWDERRQPKE
jgi:hypothetical protein